ncbi:hypothetical protein D3C81_755710 [compost metagenome]
MTKGYKAFGKGLVCRDFQYAEGETFEHEGRIEPCDSGFHFCENPLDTLDYYPLIDSNGEVTEFAPVEALGDVKTDGNKSVTNTLKIGAKLGLPGFVKASFDFLWQKCSSNPSEPDSGHSAQLASSGDSAQLASSGRYARLDLQGSDSVGAAVGIGDNQIRGEVGCWITLAEWTWDGDKYVPVCVKTAQIDGEVIKADTWYTLNGGEFVEVDA